LEKKEKYSSMLYEEFGKENKFIHPFKRKNPSKEKKTLFPFLRKRVCNKHKNYHGQIIFNMHKS
jgi:hypothetical protein